MEDDQDEEGSWDEDSVASNGNPDRHQHKTYKQVPARRRNYGHSRGSRAVAQRRNQNTLRNWRQQDEEYDNQELSQQININLDGSQSQEQIQSMIQNMVPNGQANAPII